MKESSFYQMILDEGRADGVAQGMAQGANREAKRILLRQGERRYGPPDPETVAAIERMGGVEVIETLIDRVTEAATWAELLASSPDGE